jgi:hypothetical protein
MRPCSTYPRLHDFIVFTLSVLLVPGCASIQDTPIQAYTWELGRTCDTSMMTMSRVDSDGRYWVRPAPNVISVSPYLECMKEQARLHPFKEPAPTSQTTKKDGVVTASSDAESQRLRAEALRLYREGQYSLAVPLAERALAIQEKALGSENVGLAEPLNVLALLYKTLGDRKRVSGTLLVYVVRPVLDNVPSALLRVAGTLSDGLSNRIYSDAAQAAPTSDLQLPDYLRVRALRESTVEVCHDNEGE